MLTWPPGSIRSADQAQALGLHLTSEQAERRKPDLGLWRARDHGAERVTHHDVAQAQRRAADFVVFQHGAADLDAVLAAEPLLDRRCEPWREEIDRDRAGGELPPHHAAAHDGGECDGARADQHLAGERRAVCCDMRAIEVMLGPQPVRGALGKLAAVQSQGRPDLAQCGGRRIE
jgi:hypothetical protein